MAQPKVGECMSSGLSESLKNSSDRYKSICACHHYCIVVSKGVCTVCMLGIYKALLYSDASDAVLLVKTRHCAAIGIHQLCIDVAVQCYIIKQAMSCCN